MDKAQLLDPFKNSVTSLFNLNLSFLDNKTTIDYTKENLKIWLNRDMDRIFLSNDDDVHDFYRTMYRLISEFESEHANCENTIIVAIHKQQFLLNYLYPSYQDTINRYFEALSKMTQNAAFINNLPTFQAPTPESILNFYDRYAEICDNFLRDARSYNNKIIEIDQLRTLNHRTILNNNIIQRLLKNDKANLRKIFDTIHVSRLTIVPR